MRKHWYLAIFVAIGISAAWAADRHVKDGVFYSDANPVLTLRVDPALDYVGLLRFPLMETSNVERHVWVAAEDSQVTTLLIFQFETIMTGVDGTYRFNIPGGARQAGSNFRYTPERIELGDHAYVHNTWAFDLGETARLNPRAESAHTTRMLAENGYELPNEFIMSRFVTEVGEDSRSEFIIYYMESLRAHGKSLEDFPDGGPPIEAYDTLSQSVKQRSLEAIGWSLDN